VCFIRKLNKNYFKKYSSEILTLIGSFNKWMRFKLSSLFEKYCLFNNKLIETTDANVYNLFSLQTKTFKISYYLETRISI